MHKKSRIFVSGHTGMVGMAVVSLLRKEGYRNLILRSSQELDLRNQAKVSSFMHKEKPEYVFLFAARVGGIQANISHPAEFLYDNIMIEANIIESSYRLGIKKLLYLGSSCAYPRECPQPMKEEYLLTGKPEPTNEGYALAKIIGLKMCEYYNQQYGTNFICLVPPNLYGPGDNFDLANSHVIPALIRKFVEAKRYNLPHVEVWGTGLARREFLYTEDVALACLYFIKRYDAKNFPCFVNIGYGKDLSIKELAGIISDKVGYKGKILWDKVIPEGMPRKLLNNSKARKLLWKPKTTLDDGIVKTVLWYKNNYLDY
ncbi:MAG: GDP-L-fucose synthase [Candidatus Omnitrophica bacterium]|nr:GDP-L-fucose synthase [Candidatus Omnitrophota bacterium]